MGKLCLWTELRQGEWLLKAYFPSSPQQRSEWTVYVYRGDTIVRQVKLPISGPVMFGPDGCDAAEIEESLATMMKELVATKPAISD